MQRAATTAQAAALTLDMFESAQPVSAPNDNCRTAGTRFPTIAGKFYAKPDI